MSQECILANPQIRFYNKLLLVSHWHKSIIRLLTKLIKPIFLI